MTTLEELTSKLRDIDEKQNELRNIIDSLRDTNLSDLKDKPKPGVKVYRIGDVVRLNDKCGQFSNKMGKIIETIIDGENIRYDIEVTENAGNRVQMDFDGGCIDHKISKTKVFKIGDKVRIIKDDSTGAKGRISRGPYNDNMYIVVAGKGNYEVSGDDIRLIKTKKYSYEFAQHELSVMKVIEAIHIQVTDNESDSLYNINFKNSGLLHKLRKTPRDSDQFALKFKFMIKWLGWRISDSGWNKGKYSGNYMVYCSRYDGKIRSLAKTAYLLGKNYIKTEGI